MNYEDVPKNVLTKSETRPSDTPEAGDSDFTVNKLAVKVQLQVQLSHHCTTSLLQSSAFLPFFQPRQYP